MIDSFYMHNIKPFLQKQNQVHTTAWVYQIIGGNYEVTCKFVQT